MNNSYGYKLKNDFGLNCGEGIGYNYSIIEDDDDNIVFTQLPSQKNCTRINFIDYLYKDNIVLEDQSCHLENIYLREENAPNTEVLLNCEFNSTESMSYCYIDKEFRTGNIDFNVYFKYGRTLLNTYQKLHIYNSIKDSDFVLLFREPNLSIISSNFNMMNLTQVIIDNSQIKDSFLIQSSNNVSFEYYLPNDTLKHNVTKVIRADKTNDRTSTIKHKDLNLRILELECPEFQVPIGARCWDCLSLILANIIEGDRIWAQGNTCVSKCDNSAGYRIFDKNNHYCKICKEYTLLYDLESNQLIEYCSCLVGTVKSFENEMCYLPEMDEITDLTKIQKSTQCYKADRITHNYCDANNTLSCAVETVKGIFFPICTCREGFTGKYCEFEETKINLTESIDDILSNNNVVNEANITMISKIRGVSYFLEIESSFYMKQLQDNSMSIYINSSIHIFENIINNGRNTVPQIFDVVEMALCFLKYRIDNSKGLRRLDEDNDRKNLNYLVNNLHYVNVKANNSTRNYKIQTDRLNLTTFIVYKKNDLVGEDFKLEMANLSYFKIMEYADLNNGTNDDELIFVTLINSSLFEDEVNKDDFGVRAYFSTSKDMNNTNNINSIKNFTFYISSSVIHFNFYLAEYYFNKNIKIYDKNDLAFIDPCFLSEDFDFDLTQKYRKNNVFQKINYGNNVCKYVNFEYKYKRLIFECNDFSYNNKTNNLTYGIISFSIQKESINDANKVYNLPTKCTKKIKSVGSNWAFWFFLIICIFEIIYCIGISILTFGSLRVISFRKGLIQDNFYQIIPHKKEDDANPQSISNSIHLPKYAEKEIKNNQNKFNYYNDLDNNSVISYEAEYRSFKTCLLNNLKELHPLFTLCRVSMISPLILNSILFVFNTLILFGFNALLYYESLLEKRIYDKRRNNFAYPMRKEFHKIIFSILCQIALCIIVKLILIVTFRQRNNFIDELKNCHIRSYGTINNKIVATANKFEDEMFLRRIISSSVMVIIILFFFYYSVAFCAVYIQTQRNWFFSGIWALFWNWVVFSPIYIFIISLVEYNKQDLNDPTIYYLKRLFFF